MSNEFDENKMGADEILPAEVFQLFKQWVGQGMKPSTAIRKLMQSYRATLFEPDAIIHMLNLTYPDFDIQRGGLRFKINDSNYPHSDPLQFSDDDFDAAVEKMLRTPW